MFTHPVYSASQGLVGRSFWEFEFENLNVVALSLHTCSLVIRLGQPSVDIVETGLVDYVSAHSCPLVSLG